MNPENPLLAIRQANRQYYAALDGLRGTAILLIVLYHNFGFTGIFSIGWIGVDLFFVLSGFLITDILLRTLGDKRYLSNFYLRRVLRIFPLYYLCLILFLIILPKLNLQFDVKYYTDNQVWLWTYLQNWLYAFNNPDQTNTLNHLWSLAVEEQFYLLWPLVILLIRKTKWLLSFICILFVLLPGARLWVWMQQFPDLAYFNLFTFTRIDSICAGCMIALLLQVNRDFLKKYSIPIILFVALLNITFYYFNRSQDFTYPHLALVGYSTVAVMFGLIVNNAITGKSKLITLLFDSRLLKFFGKISYGFYIFHWPVYLLLSPLLFQWVAYITGGVAQQYIVSALATAAGAGLSWLSFQYYERHFLKLKDKFV